MFFGSFFGLFRTASPATGNGERTPWWLALLSWLVVATLFIAAYRVWHPPSSPRRANPIVCSPGKAKKFAVELRALARVERMRSCARPGLAARQAAWIAANAEYVLVKTKPFVAKKILKPSECKLLESTYRRVRWARTQSRHGAAEIQELAGARIRAYWSPVDGTLQPYSLTIPKTYDPALPWPLIVSLHGHGWFRPFQGHPAPGYSGAFCVSPHGRGATDYRDLGENDVLNVIAEVRRDFHIDPDRVYVKGSSMGGTGAWNLGVHYADRFAGIMPICGNADSQAWTSRWQWNAAFEGRFEELRDWIQEAHTARAFVGNLSNLPSYILHGAGDTVVPPEHSRHMVAELRRLQCPVQYREFPGKGHGGFPGSATSEGLSWICGYARTPFPKSVRWTTNLLKHGRAYWIRIDAKWRPDALATVNANAVDRNHVILTTENVQTVSILRSPQIFTLDLPLFVQIDGERVIFPPRDLNTAPTWSTLERSALGWNDIRQTPSLPTVRKRPGLEGPINEAFLAPFVLVVGTCGSLDKRVFWMREARAFAKEWKRRNGAPCSFIRDTDCSETIAQNHNLILLGDGRENSVSARLEGQKSFADAVAPLAARIQWAGPDAGFLVVHPNPEHPDRLVVLHAANGIPAIYQAWGRFGNWFNWGVYDSKKYFDFAVYDNRSSSPESMLVLGYFDTEWSMNRGVEIEGVDSIREAMAPLHFPAETAMPATDTAFDLYQLLPASIDQMRGAVAFGRTFQGEPLARSIGLRAPAFIEYNLDGTVDSLITGCAVLGSPESGLTKAMERSERVRFVIKADGIVVGSSTVSWHTPMAQIEVDLRGVRKLRLETVPAGGPSWLHMGAAWLAPRLYREQPHQESARE
ncbi:MAG: prolyl oligopeptidase family serine peptidase [Lentisphaeria bacterium]|nr:prolyl oligopeptidase family serine peptidase [Lentisphaeria bacterium]